jgi:hypothetical protein
MRPYSGTNDGIAIGEKAGLRVLVNYIEKQTDSALWNNGTFVNRSMRGKASLSVHATGRAVDMSFRKTATKGKVHGRKYAVVVMDFLTKHADDLGLEAILDYNVLPFGRGWRCDRGTWQVYKKDTIHGAPTADWIHVEINPAMANNPDKMREVLLRLGDLPPVSDFGTSS